MGSPCVIHSYISHGVFSLTLAWIATVPQKLDIQHSPPELTHLPWTKWGWDELIVLHYTANPARRGDLLRK